jgi:hypothetical protein
MVWPDDSGNPRRVSANIVAFVKASPTEGRSNCHYGAVIAVVIGVEPLFHWVFHVEVPSLWTNATPVVANLSAVYPRASTLDRNPDEELVTRPGMN